MPRAVMEGDGSKPDNKLPSAFRPGGTVAEGLVEMWRDNVRWEVLGWADNGSLWCRTQSGARAWIAPGSTRSTTSSRRVSS